MGFMEKLTEIAEKIAEFFSSEKPVKIMENALKAASLVVQIISVFNEEPSNPRKREISRNVFKFLKYATVADLEELIALKKTGDLDDILPHESDAIIGIATGLHVQEKNNARPEAEPFDFDTIG